jgi:hypothetical protein
MLSRGYSGEPATETAAPLTAHDRLIMLWAFLLLAAILFFAFLTTG